MSLTVVFRETALRNLARIRGTDKEAALHAAKPRAAVFPSPPARYMSARAASPLLRRAGWRFTPGPRGTPGVVCGNPAFPWLTPPTCSPQ